MCHQVMETLKENMSPTPILTFPDSTKVFHINLDASSISLGVTLAHLREGDLDHIISFASRMLSITKQNYTNTERQGLTMVYALNKYHHYLLGNKFKLYTNHFTLRYYMKNLVLGECICRWLLILGV